MPWAPSAIAIRGNDKFGDNKPYPIPVEMSEADIKNCIKEFRQAAENAQEAGVAMLLLNI